MTTIVIPAARVKQGELVLFATSIRVRDLALDNFYNVETLDPENKDDKGYQRLLNTARAKKLADYILKASPVGSGCPRCRGRVLAWGARVGAELACAVGGGAGLQRFSAL